MGLPVIAAAPSSAWRAERGSVGSPNAANDTGSFMSCQTPENPCASRSAYSPPHHSRTCGSVKSGYTHSPGHTSPRTGLPRPSRTNAPEVPTAAPLSKTAFPGSAATAGSTIDTSRTPSSRNSFARPGRPGNRSRSTVNTRCAS